MPFKDPIKAKEYHKQYMRKYLADPIKRAKRNKVANDRVILIRKWLDDYKISKGCIDCGYKSHPKALHFDHKNSKDVDLLKNIYDALYVKSFNF